MIPKFVLTATVFTVLLLLIRIFCTLSDNKKIYQIILCAILSFFSGLFWGMSLFPEVTWYSMVAAYGVAILFGVFLTPRLNNETQQDITLIGKCGVVTEKFSDDFFISEYKGKLDSGEDIIFNSKEELNVGDNFEIKEVSDKIWVWKKE